MLAGRLRRGVVAAARWDSRSQPSPLVEDSVVRPVIRRVIQPVRSPEWHALPLGRVRRLHVADLVHRVAIATDALTPRSAPLDGFESTAELATTYAVGFGCEPVPASPTPNPDYQWTLT